MIFVVAHHASERCQREFEVSISSLLPLLPDQAHPIATVKHAMDLVKETTAFLNPGQIPVITADQPLFGIKKQIQWEWSFNYGEDKYFNTEIAAFKVLGDLLKDCGWTAAVSEAEIKSPGAAESFLRASNITKTRLAHQITACILYKLYKVGYSKYVTEAIIGDEGVLSFMDWCPKRKLKSPQFFFWSMVLNLELVIFLFIRSY